MSLPSTADYELLLECIGQLHAFSDIEAIRAWLLETALPKLVPSDWLSYNEVDLLRPEKTLAILRPDAQSDLQPLLRRFSEVAHQHPLIIGQMQSNDFPVHKISDFLAQEDYHALELYQDVYRHMGVEYQISATVKLEPDRITAFALSRQRSDYTERDRTILELLRPHLVIALNNLALVREHQSVVDSTELALKELASATMIVDRQDRILYHTGPGLKWIGAANQGILPVRISRWLNEAATSVRRQAMSLNSDVGEIRIRYVPTAGLQRRMLVLTAETLWQSIAVQTNDFGLSRRQLDVARRIGEGKTNAEIAEILGISPRTVQKHIEHIFDKMGVKTRVAVASRLHGFPTER